MSDDPKESRYDDAIASIAAVADLLDEICACNGNLHAVDPQAFAALLRVVHRELDGPRCC